MDLYSFFFVLIFGGLYLLPIFIAVARRHRHLLPIVLTTLFFGWSGIGWVGALVWAALPSEKTEPLERKLAEAGYWEASEGEEEEGEKE